MITGTLRSSVDKLWETLWTGGVSNPLTVIEQITYLLFLKRLDDNQTLKEKQSAKLGGPIETITPRSTTPCAGRTSRTRTPIRSSRSSRGPMPNWTTSRFSTS